MKYYLLALPVVFAAVTLSLIGCRRSPEALAGDEAAVQVISVSTKALPDEIIAAGAIDAVDKAEVGFLVAGRIVSVDVEDGAEVKKDQVLARIDPSDLQQTLAIAESRLAEVSARHERLTKLHELGSLTDTDFDKIESALHEAQSSAELARHQLAYTELRAPFDGIAVRRGLAAGVVAVPAAPVFTVLAPAPVWANVGVAEADARRVQHGQGAQVFLPASNDQSNIGKVEAVLPQADPLSRSFTVKIRLANDNHALHPGNVVTAHIATGTSHVAITLPPQAVQKHPDGSLYVWIVDPTRHTSARQIVETGPLQNTEIEISSGLKPGDLVVLNVPFTLFEGTPLKVTVAP
jgi:RND family efflux transporter MFP subunit